MAEQRGSQPGQLRVGDRAEVEPGHMTRVCGGSSPPPREASENYAGVTPFTLIKQAAPRLPKRSILCFHGIRKLKFVTRFLKIYLRTTAFSWKTLRSQDADGLPRARPSKS
jgi:hypothetical protein